MCEDPTERTRFVKAWIIFVLAGLLVGGVLWLTSAAAVAAAVTFGASRPVTQRVVTLLSIPLALLCSFACYKGSITSFVLPQLAREAPPDRHEQGQPESSS